MKTLFISMVFVSLLASRAFCEVKIEHERSTEALKEAIKVSPSKENLLLALPEITKTLTGGEVIICSQKGNDGKYTLFYSSVSGGTTSEMLSGERETNTRKMFDTVNSMKAGDWMGFDFKYQKNGKDIPMQSHIFPVNESIICVLVWPTSGLSEDIGVGMDMAKIAPSTAPVAAVPLISTTAPMQQGQSSAVPPVNGGVPVQMQPTVNPAVAQTLPPAVGGPVQMLPPATAVPMVAPPATVVPPVAVTAPPPAAAVTTLPPTAVVSPVPAATVPQPGMPAGTQMPAPVPAAG
ncbi:MAG: hypothetical protein K2W94_01995 [Alphaproteobacteria bacterium]|nr:hypothetical protein [Alphaproteobacteria bacterium]